MPQSENLSPSASPARRRVLWCMDVFEEADGPRSRMEPALAAALAGIDAEVEPIYVLSPDQLGFTWEFSEKGLESYIPPARRALERIARESRLPGLKAGDVVLCTKPSLRGAVHTLVAHARARGAEMIVVGSHGRKGMPRLFLGSFAETLLLLSDVPVMVVNESCEQRAGADRIVFATDLSPAARTALPRVIELAREKRARLTLYHALPRALEPIVQNGVFLLGGGWVPYPQFREDAVAAARKLGEPWVLQARQAGLDAELVVDEAAVAAVEGVIEQSRRGEVAMVAMAAQAGPVAAALLGSVTRQVVRGAQCPVWVVRPPATT